MRALGLFGLIFCLAFVALGCAPGPSQATTVCAPGYYPYKGGCADGVTQNFATCTETRGQNLSIDERAKLGASIEAGIKGGGSGLIEVSRSVVETELPEVSMEIVRGCLELSRSALTPPEQLALDQIIGEITKGTITLDPGHGPYDQQISVSGTGWAPNTELEVAAQDVKMRVITSADGTFSTTISLDLKFEAVAPPQVTIRVGPVELSTQAPASAIYTIEK